MLKFIMGFGSCITWVESLRRSLSGGFSHHRNEERLRAGVAYYKMRCIICILTFVIDFWP